MNAQLRAISVALALTHLAYRQKKKSALRITLLALASELIGEVSNG